MQYISIVFSLILLLLAIVFLPQLFTSLHDVQVSTVTESGNVTTGVAITTGNLTLTESLYRDATSSVLSLTSTNTNDVPFTITYSTGNQTLTVGGLEGNASRILSAEYGYINPANNSNLGVVATFIGILVAVSFIILLVVIPGGTIADIWRKFR